MGHNSKCGANFESKREEGKWLNQKISFTKLHVLMFSIQLRLLHFDPGSFDLDGPPYYRLYEILQYTSLVWISASDP